MNRKHPHTHPSLPPSRRALLLLCLGMALGTPFPALHAQMHWNYMDIAEMHLDDAYLIPPPDSLQSALNRAAKTDILYGRTYRLTVEWPKKNRARVCFQSDSCTFTLRDRQLEPLLPYLVSDRYWRHRLSQLQRWTFVSADNGRLLEVDTTDLRCGGTSPLAWISYAYVPSLAAPVKFTVRTNVRKNQVLGLVDMEVLAKYGAFSTDSDIDVCEQAQREHEAAERARQQALQRQLDSLDREGRQAARLTDSIATAIRRDSLALAEQELRQQVQATKERMNRDQIFLMSLRAARSDYMFGLEFNFYNCFPKTITKIEATVMPVNERGQVQADQFKRSTRTVRCMGPVQPGAPAQYTFDELFWDDGGRIKYMRLTSVTFHFPDGTRRTFSGYQKILNHTLNP
ncbi:MAG: hypothetical protein J6I49_00905 [Bacteroidales bacterium]|nr:hypothetical protein [Bacteroidales bacterium]